MFGIEHSKDNFTLLRFTKPQLGLDEHVCVYRGGKGEHTVSFFADGAQGLSSYRPSNLRLSTRLTSAIYRLCLLRA
jgi:hypothetical protein